MKYVYFFGAGKAEGDGAMKEMLGGKGAGLAEMTRIGLPVPAGFTITTECCDYYLKHDHKYPKSLAAEVKKNLERLERATKKKTWRREGPAAGERAVRLGAVHAGNDGDDSELGLNSKSVEALARNTKNERFAWDAYRRFVQMYSTVVIGLSKEELEEKLRAMKTRQRERRHAGARRRMARNWSANTRSTSRRKRARIFPEDPEEQLWGAIGAVFGSWMAEKAVTYRRVERITGLLGTAVNVVQMVFGNTGDNSGTGVCFTRDPSTGEKIFTGIF